MEVLQGKNDLLFNPDGTTPYAFTAFVKSSLDIGENSTLLFGPSFATGKARITTVADGTFFSGTPTSSALNWSTSGNRPGQKASSSRANTCTGRQNGDLARIFTSAPPSHPLKRIQDGLYVQALYQWERWRFGVALRRA